MHPVLYLSTLLTASAAYLPLHPRAYSDPCVADIQDNEQVFNDAVTADGTAGIGAEFESPFFYFVNDKCSPDDTNAARKKVVAERTGTNWELTADTGASRSGGKLNAEYILDGREIKVGGDGDKVAKSIADDLIAWKPWQGTPPNYVNIEDNKCNPWRIDAPNVNDDPAKVPWEPQITTSMPLEAVYSLMKEQKALVPTDPKRNILDGDGPSGLILVTKDFFQSSPNGIDGSKLTDDVLGFCSLVLSYGKAANNKLQPDMSPKLFITFMPRTEFNTLFGLVKSSLPGDLFALFNILACYKDNAALDTAYCKGPVAQPVPNTKFAGLSYTNEAANPTATVNIKDWISGIGKQDPSPDLLSKFDESIDGSIGGKGTDMEKMYQSQRSAPLIEFRNLLDRQTSQIEQFMKDVDSSIQNLHKDFANPPNKKKLRRDAPATCTMPADPGPTNNGPAPPPAAPPTVVAPVDPPSQPSCVPSPTGNVKDAHEGEMQKVAKFFCDQYASNTNAQAPVNIAQTVMAGTRNEGRATVDIAFDYPSNEGNQDDVYDIKLTSVPNCTPQHGFNLASPVANSNCPDILHTAWKNCNNQGRGGDITAGCLVYSIHTKY